MNIKNYWNWMLGTYQNPNGTWLSFDTTNLVIPTLIYNPVIPYTASEECSSSISDDNGNVIFYSNGYPVYNNTSNVPISYLLPDISQTLQGIVSIQNPYNSNEYYSFYVKNWRDGVYCDGSSWAQRPNDLYWSKLIFSGQTLVSSSVNNILAPAVANLGSGGFCHTGKGYAEVINLIPHDNGTDFWVINKPTGTDSGGPTNWEAYLVDSNGPMISGLPTLLVSSPSNFVYDGYNRRGGLKINLSRNKILFAVGDYDNSTKEEATVVLCDFDNSTGQVISENILMKTSYIYRVYDVITSAYVNITSYTNHEILGCEFSPNSNFLYINMTNDSSVSSFTGILQIDLSNIGSWPISTIPNTTITIPQANALFRSSPIDPISGGPIRPIGMQLGPDQKIYYNVFIWTCTGTPLCLNPPYLVKIDTPNTSFNSPSFFTTNVLLSGYGANQTGSQGLPVVYVGAFEPTLNFELTPCNEELPTLIIEQYQINLSPEDIGSVVCILNPEGENTCYTLSLTEEPINSEDLYTANAVYTTCEECQVGCPTPINNILLTPCISGGVPIVVPNSNYDQSSLVTSGDIVCIQSGPYVSECYTKSITQLSATTQDIITPLASFGSCTDCEKNCSFKFYILVDCLCGEIYLDSLGQPVQFWYKGSTSTYVTSLGGIDFLTKIVMTNIFNSSKVEIASGCLVLTEVDYIEGQNYTSIVDGIDNLFYTETCVQCRLSNCSDVDETSVERINCRFGDAVYALMLNNRYGLETCCEEDIQKWSIKKELSDLNLLKQGYLICDGAATTCSPVCLPTKSSCGTC